MAKPSIGLGSGNCMSSGAFIVLLILSVVIQAADENCTVCPGGDQMAFPEKLLNLTWPVIADSCSSLDQYTRSLGIDSDECTRIQSISSICGCPISEDACKLCPDGSNITEHNKNLSFLEADFDGITPTCELLDAYLHSVNSESSNCTEAQLVSSLCGCPVDEEACVFCTDEEAFTADKVLGRLQGVDDFQNWEFDPPTCELVAALVYSRRTAGTNGCRQLRDSSIVCGCSPSDSFRRRQAVLAWLPRISSPLSFFGSVLIIYDILKHKRNRQSTQFQLLLHMSLIDTMSSIAWGLSTAPVPVTDEDGNPTYVYGARGTKATCTAQGFFIQLGLASPFYNLALAFYYMLVIFYGWSGTRIKKVSFWMYSIPITMGLGLALGGIPLYDSDVSMCYISSDGDTVGNSLIFLVIPITTVIVSATLIMVKIYVKVYYQERAARRWVMRRRENVSSLSKKVFWQGFFYLLCFYVTWPVLVVISFVDNSFYNAYGLLCMAILVAPSQGFLNSINYFRPHLRRCFERRQSCCVWRGLGEKNTERLEHGDELQLNESDGVMDSAVAVSVVSSELARPVDFDKAESERTELSSSAAVALT